MKQSSNICVLFISFKPFKYLYFTVLDNHDECSGTRLTLTDTTLENPLPQQNQNNKKRKAKVISTLFFSNSEI